MVTAADIMSKNFLSVDSTEPISSVIGKLMQQDLRAAVVFCKDHKAASIGRKSSQKYHGVIDRDLLIESKIDSTSAEAGSFVAHPPVVKEDEDLMKCAELMYGSYPCVLPVQKGSEILGVIMARDITKHIRDFPKLKNMRISEIMTSNLIVFSYDARLGDAINVMHEKGFSRIPVVDKLGRVAGVFSLTDAIIKHLKSPIEKVQGGSRKGGVFFPKSYAPNKILVLNAPIGDAASAITVTAGPDEKLGKVVDDMFEYRISDVIITREKKPVGIVTTRDLLRAFTLLKAPDYWGIQVFGCEKLVPQQYDSVREQTAELYEKAKRVYFNDIKYLMVHVKIYEPKETKKKKYSIHLRLATPSQVFTTEYANFDLNTAVSWAVKNMEMMMQKFKEKTRQRWLGYRKGRRKVFGTYLYEA